MSTSPQTADRDKILWQHYKNGSAEKKAVRPSFEELAEFIDGSASSAGQKNVLRWLAEDKNAVDELALLRESLTLESGTDNQIINKIKIRACNLVDERHKLSRQHNFAWLKAAVDLFYLPQWAQAAGAICSILLISFFAYYGGSQAFLCQQQVEAVVADELTFGLTGSMPQPEEFPGLPEEIG